MFWSLYLIFLNVLIYIPYILGKFFSKSQDSIICLQSGVYSIIVLKKIISFLSNLTNMSNISNMRRQLFGNDTNFPGLTSILDIIFQLLSTIWLLIIGDEEGNRPNLRGSLDDFLVSVFGGPGRSMIVQNVRTLKNLLFRVCDFFLKKLYF